MTTQIHDTIDIEGTPYAITGVDGSGLFDPLELDVFPVSLSTSCWRGYVCAYKVSDGRLVLDSLQLSLGAFAGEGAARNFMPELGPKINGVCPSVERRTFSNHYGNLSLPIPFTGVILLGDGFIQELDVHMGFHPPWKYRTVLELTLENGQVHATRDVSEQFADIRDQMRNFD